jgi:PKD repeat protein/RNA polymerase subunit RPABC4/transcription elongation factor Spt4
LRNVSKESDFNERQSMRNQRSEKLVSTILVLVLIVTVFVTIVPITQAATLTLADGDSYDFSTNIRGRYSGGDFYYSATGGSGSFYANNLGQRGLQDLGDLGTTTINDVAPPSSGYTRFGAATVVGHTYVSLAQEGEEGNYIIFKVTSLMTDYSHVTIDYVVRVAGTPTAVFTISPAFPKVGETIVCNASGSSDTDGQIVEYLWLSEGNVLGTGETIETMGTYAGVVTLELTVTDNDGLKATTTKTIPISQPDGAPEASFTISPESPEVGETVTFDATESIDSDGEIVTYSWDFDGNTGTGNITTFSYASVGTYTVTLTVEDNDGLTDTATKDVVVNGGGDDVTPPVANAGNNMTVSAGSKVTFSAASSTDNVGITSYSWDFGDGNSATGETVSHTYGTVGNYTVTLTVTDAAGNSDTVTITITVEEATAAGFPYWIILVIVLIVVAAIVIWYFLKKRKPKEKVPEPARIKLTAEPTELMADGTSTSTITLELLDYEGKPVAALADTEISVVSSMGKVTKPIVKIPKGKGTEQTGLVASKEAGTATVSVDAKDLDRAVVAVVFLEKKRYCMHCGSKMAFTAKRCPVCGKSPPAGVDTKTCKNCEAVIPVVAKFCAECGASQPKETQ